MTMEEVGVNRVQGREEGRVTRKIEERTSRIPSGAYLALAVGSMAASAGVALRGVGSRKFRGNPRALGLANFIGQWAPTLLIIGMYNKLLKIERELAR